MRRKTYLATLLILTLSVMPILGLQSSSQNISSLGVVRYPGMAWLRTDGKWIVDNEGNMVILRGANFMGYEFGAWNQHTEEDYARMAGWGFNVVRLPITWHYIEPQPGVYNESYFTNYVDRDIVWAKKYGIYIILDMHQWYWSPHFTFFSRWGEKGNGLPTWMSEIYPNSMEGLIQAYTDFWLGMGPNATVADEINPSMKDRFRAMWKYVATRYVNESTIAAYELFNEPFQGNISTPEHANYLYSFYEKLVSDIRTIDSKHIIAYQPTAGTQNKYARLINHKNILFTFHFSDLRQNYSGIASHLETIFYNNYYTYIKDWNTPFWIGEFSTSTEYSNATCGLWVRDAVNIFRNYDLSWTWWTYYRSDWHSYALCYANGTERTELTEYLKS